MAPFKVFAHRLGVMLVYIAVGGTAIGLAYTAGDACYALGHLVGGR